MGVTEQREEDGTDLLEKEEVLPQIKEALAIEGRREADAEKKQECFEKKLEIQRKNDFDKISPVKVESEPLWEEAEREDLGRILVASRDILPWEQVTTVTITNENYCGSVEFLRWLRIRHLCWLQQIGWFASSAFFPCLTSLTPALPVPGLSVVRPALTPLRSATMDLSAGC